MNDQWARRLRENERETVIDVFRLVMQSEEFRHRHVDDAVDEIISAVEEWYARMAVAVGADPAAEEPGG